MKGELAFESLLRIDGRFEGKLISSGCLIIGKSGILMGNVDGMDEVLVDGKIVGNIKVEKLELRGNCLVFVDISCQVCVCHLVCISIKLMERKFMLLFVECHCRSWSNVSWNFECEPIFT